jgi:hypothetical protein
VKDLQVFESKNLVSSGWAFGQANHSRSGERMLLEHWSRPIFGAKTPILKMDSELYEGPPDWVSFWS